jgi:hypothetical protein
LQVILQDGQMVLSGTGEAAFNSTGTQPPASLAG